MPNQSLSTKYTSGKLLFTFVIMFRLFFFFVNTCTFSAYLLHLLLKKKSHTLLTETDARTKWKYKLIFEKKFYYKISCYNLPLFNSFFCTKSMTHKEKKTLLSLEFLRPCAIHKNVNWQKKQKKQPAASLTVCVCGWDGEWWPCPGAAHYSAWVQEHLQSLWRNLPEEGGDSRCTGNHFIKGLNCRCCWSQVCDRFVTFFLACDYRMVVIKTIHSRVKEYFSLSNSLNQWL